MIINNLLLLCKDSRYYFPADEDTAKRLFINGFLPICKNKHTTYFFITEELTKFLKGGDNFAETDNKI